MQTKSESVCQPSDQLLYVPEMMRIIGIRNLTKLDKLFEIELPGKRNLGHRPGQFVELSIFGFGEAPISVCSAPQKKGSFELCVRKAGTLTSALHQLREGDTIGIRGPFGNGFPIECMAKMDILIVAGGIGLAPLRSLINHILAKRGTYGRLTLLYGTKQPSDILFADEIEAWKANEGNEVLVTVDYPSADWEGHVGVVTTLFQKVTIDPENTVVVSLVGPPVMYRFVYMKLLKLEVPEDMIFFSLERRMRCGVGKCGHCQIGDRYACVDGPVFSGREIKKMHESI